MAIIYDYNSGKITRDFHYVKIFDACRRTQLPCRAGSDWCRRCQYYKTRLSSIDFPTFILCNHPDATDSPGYETAHQYFCEKFEQQALSQL